jgi:effector-binding domain-containing protein
MPALLISFGARLLFALAVALSATAASAQAPAAPGPAPGAPEQKQIEKMPAMPALPPLPGAPGPLQPGDAFGEAVTMPDRTIVYLSGHSNWDSAFDTLVDAFKSLNDYLDKQSIKPNGPALTIYTKTDDTGFDFQAAMPVDKAPANPPKGDIASGKAPTGNALKFVHRGSYDAMDSTYEAITNYLDDKGIEAKDLFIEEYTTDPVKTPTDKLVVNVFVPVK